MTAGRVELFVPLDEAEGDAIARAARQAGADESSVRVVRRSLDARKGHPLGWHLQLEIGAPAPVEETLPPPARARAGLKVVVVGSGPAGTFCALRLADAGAQVTIVDAGKPVQPRRHDLAALTQRGELDPWSNYCFGEGGAGTFSDGKLYTRTKDRRSVRTVLRVLVEHGAEPSIEVDARPHIGSNKLPKILVALRDALAARGVVYVWSDPVASLLGAGPIAGVRCVSGRELLGDAVVLAVGHSARQLYEELAQKGVALEAKPFAVGARLEHPQPLIDQLQYGRAAGHPRLPPAAYQVSAQAAGRGVYSFCMCPGGWIVDSSTEQGGLCTNGMSLSRRDSPLANAAMVVTVEPRDFGWAGATGVLAGLALQRKIERHAFELGGGAFRAPAQRAVDFIARRPSATVARSTYRPEVVPGDVRAALPPFVADALTLALARFARTLPGFVGPDAQLVGVETRSSAPVRILRGEDLASPSHARLYPIGEGAGYAGGIVSAAIDGLRAADAILGA